MVPMFPTTVTSDAGKKKQKLTPDEAPDIYDEAEKNNIEELEADFEPAACITDTSVTGLR